MFLKKLLNKFLAEPSSVTCEAPGCNNKVFLSEQEAYESLNNNGHLVGLCPKHLERVTAGRISDNDPTTNPDLNKPGN